MTTAYPDERDVVVAAEGVYAPQEDSRLLIDVMEKTGLAIGRRVADLCTGSGVVAITAAEQGASAVTAFDICARAVRCARVNAACAGVDVDVHLGSWARAVEFAPFDLVVCNPPYVPHDPSVDSRAAAAHDRTGARLGRRLRRATGARSAVRDRVRPAGRRRQPAAGAVRIRRTRGAPSPRCPAPDWMRKSLLGNGFRSGQC